MKTTAKTQFAQIKWMSGSVILGVMGAVQGAYADGPVVPAGSTPVAATGAAQQPGIGGMLLPFAAMFAVVYFLMIRPQQKKMKEQQDMLSALKDGDEVLTTSGLLGKITGMTDKIVTLEVAQNVRVKMLKSQIAQVVKGQIQDLT